MTSASEKVQYDIEVVVKGQDEIKALLTSLTQLSKTQGTVTTETSSHSEASTTNVETLKRQTQGMSGFNTVLSKTGNPLRNISGLFAKLNPAVILSTLGLGGLSAGFISLNNQYGKNIALNSRYVGAINQFTSVNDTFTSGLQESITEARELGISTTKLQEAYSRIIPIVQSRSVAEGLLVDAIEIRRATGIDFDEAVNKLVAAESVGAKVATDEGSRMKIGAEAVKGVKEELLAGGNAAVVFKTQTDDALDAALDSYKRFAAGMGGGIMTTLKLNLLAIIDPQAAGQVLRDKRERKESDNEAADKEAGRTHQGGAGPAATAQPNRLMSDMPPVAWPGNLPEKKYAEGGIVTKPTVGLVGEAGPEAIVPLGGGGGGGGGLFDSAEIKDKLETAFKGVPRDIWEYISGSWDTEVHWPLQDRLKALFRGDLIQGMVRMSFSEIPGQVWDFISGKWDTVVNDPFWEMVGDLFSWETMQGMIREAFIETPKEIWTTIQESWEEDINTPFWEKVDAWFSVETLHGIVQAAFVDLPKEIWTTIKEKWEEDINTPFWEKVDAWFSVETINGIVRAAFVDLPKEVWATIQKSWEEDINTPFWEKVDAWFSVETLTGIVRAAFVDLPKEIWATIQKSWEEDINTPFWEKVDAWFSVETLTGIVRAAFVDLPKEIWASITATWEEFVNDPFWIKVGELFSWETLKGMLELVFIQVPTEIWKWITETWEDALSSPFWAKIGEIFNWASIVEYIKAGFSGLGKEIWKYLGPGVTYALEQFSKAWADIECRILEPVEKAIKKAYGLLSKMWSAVTSGISSALDYARENMPVFTEDSAPEGVPGMAAGGIVTRPTLAMVGEAGPEAVIPLSQLGELGGGNSQVIEINIDGRRFERFVLDSLDRRVRLRGGQ